MVVTQLPPSLITPNSMKYKMEKALFAQMAHRVGSEQLQKCSSGNLSLRIKEDIALISGTGSWLPTIQEEQITVCRISTGEVLDGPKPSMEHVFHLNVLRERKEINVVLHFQSQYATTLSCLKEQPKSLNVIAEVPCICGPHIPTIPYYRPGSKELAAAVTNALKEHDCVLMSQHGQAVCGTDFENAFQKAIFFELASKIIVLAGPGNYKEFTPEEIKDMDKYILGKTENK